MPRKTAQELMDEINLLTRTLDRMKESIKDLYGTFHSLSGCTGSWSPVFDECEYDYDDDESCIWPKSPFLEKKFWQMEEFYEKKKDKIEERIQLLHKRRNAIAKSIPRSSGLGKIGSIASTYGSIPKEH